MGLDAGRRGWLASVKLNHMHARPQIGTHKGETLVPLPAEGAPLGLQGTHESFLPFQCTPKFSHTAPPPTYVLSFCTSSLTGLLAPMFLGWHASASLPALPPPPFLLLF